MPIPNVLEFMLPPFRMVDTRRMSAREAHDVILKFNEILVPILESTRNTSELCKTAPLVIPEIPSPAPPPEEIARIFQERPDPVVPPDQCSPVLENILFAAFQGPPDREVPSVTGALSMYDVEVLFEDDERIEVAAKSAGAFPSNSDNQLAQRWGLAKRRLLETDLLLADGRILDLVEWRYPTAGDFTWTSFTGTDNIADIMIGELGADHDLTRVEFQGRQVPEKMHRRGHGQR